VLPSLPATWPEGTVKGLQARGGRGVDIRWEAGTLKEVRVTARNAGNVTVRHVQHAITLTLKTGETAAWDGTLAAIR
jgi:alpha-L-fucosidase 2